MIVGYPGCRAKVFNMHDMQIMIEDLDFDATVALVCKTLGPQHYFADHVSGFECTVRSSNIGQ
jgi:hypothetical protein